MPDVPDVPPTRAEPRTPAFPPMPAVSPAVPPAGPPVAGRPGYGPPTYGAAPYGPQHGPAAYPYGVPGRYVHPGMLAAAADRERTMDVLKAAYTEGRLTKGEFD